MIRTNKKNLKFNNINDTRFKKPRATSIVAGIEPKKQKLLTQML